MPGGGTPAAPLRFICVNRLGSVPPVPADKRTTAVVQNSGDSNLYFSGSYYCYGITFIAGNGTGNPIIMIPNGAGNRSVFESCSLRIGSTGPDGYISVGYAGNSPGSVVEFLNTTVGFTAVTQFMYMSCDFRWRDTPAALVGTIPTVLLVPSSPYPSHVSCVGVDFSAAGAGKTICGTSGNSLHVWRFRFADCKFNPAVTKHAAAQWRGLSEVDHIRSDAGNYEVYSYRFDGTLVHDTAVKRVAGGASDGVTSLSWKIVTTTALSDLAPYETPPIAVWNDTVGAPVTATIEGLGPGGALDNECFLDLEYLGSTLGQVVSDRTPVLATPALQTASSEVWSLPAVTPNYSVFDIATQINVSLSNGDLTATHTTADSNSGIKAKQQQAAGLYYFEATWGATNGTADCVGILDMSQNNIGWMVQFGWYCTMVRATGGVIYSNSGTTGYTLGTIVAGDVVSVAINLTTRLGWFRKNGGNWNGNATANPATGVNGVGIPVGNPHIPVVGFGGSGTAIGANITANFGQSAFAYTPPAGFAAWGQPLPLAAFKLECTFTPQRKGWVYARVKIGKTTSTYYIDPKVKLT